MSTAPEQRKFRYKQWLVPRLRDLGCTVLTRRGPGDLRVVEDPTMVVLIRHDPPEQLYEWIQEARERTRAAGGTDWVVFSAHMLRQSGEGAATGDFAIMDADYASYLIAKDALPTPRD